MIHGTEAGYRRHLATGEPACDECKRAAADAANRRRHARGVTPRRPAVCGTASGYARHIADGSAPCEPCRRAHADDLRRYRRDRRRVERRGSIADVIVDYLETYDRPLSRAVLVDLIRDRHPDLTESSIRTTLARLNGSGRVRTVTVDDEVRYAATPAV